MNNPFRRILTSRGSTLCMRIFQIVSFISILIVALSIWISPFNKVYGKGQIVVCSNPDSIIEYAYANKTIPINIDPVFFTKSQLTIKKDSSLLSNNKKTIYSEFVDSVGINLEFLEEMRKNGQLLTSDEFASRITSYYDTLVAVLGAMFILFSISTYFTFRQNFEKKFDIKEDKIDKKISNSENKIKEKQQKIEDHLRGNIRSELKDMLRDSKEVTNDIINALTGVIEGHFATQEDIDRINDIIVAIDKKQKDLISEVAEIQEISAHKEIVIQEDTQNLDSSTKRKKKHKDGNKGYKKD